MTKLSLRLLYVVIVGFMSAGLLGSKTAIAQHTQGQVDLTPYIGVFIPISDIIESGAIEAGSSAAAHEVDLMFGGKLTYWMKSEMGIELDVLFAPNALESDVLGIPGTTDATLLTISGRLVYDFGSNPAKPSFLLTGGLGVFTTSYDSPLDMTAGGMGILGLGLRIPLGPSIALRLDLSDYISTARWELADGGKTDKVLQNDLTVTGGLTISF